MKENKRGGLYSRVADGDVKGRQLKKSFESHLYLIQRKHEGEKLFPSAPNEWRIQKKMKQSIHPYSIYVTTAGKSF